MSAWVDRVSLEQATSALRTAWRDGWLDRALLFHDIDQLTARLSILKERFPNSALHAIAIKANPLVEVLKVIAASGAGLEAASMEEVMLALAAGCPAERIIYDSPAKSTTDIREALDLGVHINADSLDELHRIHLQGGPRTGTVGLRVNPEVGGGRISMTSTASTSDGAAGRFGVPLSSRDSIFQAFASYPWLSALHAHVGSQGCAVELLVESAARLDALLTQLRDRGHHITTIDIGGGLPTSYRTDEPAPELNDYVTQLEAKAPGLFTKEIKLMTEFGRSVQAGCGFAASRVEYVDQAAHLATLHLGADFLLRPVYQSKDWSHEIAVVDASGHLKKGKTSDWTLVGPLCFTGDVLARGRALPDIEPGDWVIIRDTGAYTLALWSRHCSRAIPPVLGWGKAGLSLLRRGEQPDDLVSFWGRD